MSPYPVEFPNLTEKVQLHIKSISKVLTKVSTCFDSYIKNLELTEFSKNNEQNSDMKHLDEIAEYLSQKNFDINFCCQQISDLEDNFNKHTNIVDDLDYEIKKLTKTSKRYHQFYKKALQDNEILQAWVSDMEIESEEQFKVIQNLESQVFDYNELQGLLKEKDQEIYEIKLNLQQNQIKSEKKVLNLSQELIDKRKSVQMLEVEAFSLRRMCDEMNKNTITDRYKSDIDSQRHKSTSVRKHSNIYEWEILAGIKEAKFEDVKETYRKSIDFYRNNSCATDLIPPKSNPKNASDNVINQITDKEFNSYKIDTIEFRTNQQDLFSQTEDTYSETSKEKSSRKKKNIIQNNLETTSMINLNKSGEDLS